MRNIKLFIAAIGFLFVSSQIVPAQIYAEAYSEQIREDYKVFSVVADALENVPHEAVKAVDFTPKH